MSEQRCKHQPVETLGKITCAKCGDVIREDSPAPAGEPRTLGIESVAAKMAKDSEVLKSVANSRAAFEQALDDPETWRGIGDSYKSAPASEQPTGAREPEDIVCDWARKYTQAGWLPDDTIDGMVDEIRAFAASRLAHPCDDPEVHTDFMVVYKEMVKRGTLLREAEARLAAVEKIALNLAKALEALLDWSPSASARRKSEAALKQWQNWKTSGSRR